MKKGVVMEYWKEMYGTCDQSFIDGVVAGIEAFAVWDSGKQYVGVLMIPLENVLRGVREQLGGDGGD